MAPELFQPGAPHSSASDLWALGCVLYECAAGRPPFMSTSLTQLVHEILNTDPAPIPGAAKFHPCAPWPLYPVHKKVHPDGVDTILFCAVYPDHGTKAKPQVQNPVELVPVPQLLKISTKGGQINPRACFSKCLSLLTITNADLAFHQVATYPSGVVSSGASPEFEDLVSRLLDKNPATRIGWAELPGHGFWMAPLPPRDMPPEPLLEQFIAEHGLTPASPAESQASQVNLLSDLQGMEMWELQL